MTILVELAGVAVAGVVGWKARKATRRADQDHVDVIADRVIANTNKGSPYAAEAAATVGGGNRPDREPANGTVCHGRLTVHEDGVTTSCHGGLDTCWGADSHAHASRAIRCRDLSHGCGVCLTAGHRSDSGPDRSHY